MIYNDCRDCELYKGDCGHHFIDGYNHINYNIPTESRMDNVMGSHGSCFVASEQYSLETKKEVIEEITRKYSVETIRMALKEKEKEQLIGSGELYPGEFESRHYDFEEESEE